MPGCHRQPPRPRARTAARLLVAAGAALALPRVSAAEAGPCREGEPCVLVEHEPALAGEAGLVVDALARKLAPRGLGVAADPGGERRREREGSAAPTWIVHLRTIPPDELLVTVSGPDPEEGEGVVRELRRGEDLAETARTAALIIEEYALARQADGGEQAPLGAGLAIIEPPAVGGVKVPERAPEEGYPRLRGVEIGLAGSYMAASDDLVAGPRLRLDGAAARRLVVSVAAGWAGTATFAGAGVRGTASALPVEAQAGVVLVPGRIVELSAEGGFSVGFAIYRTSGGGEQRTDILFDPWLLLGLRAILRVGGPWAVAVEGGGALMLIRDELRNGGGTVYAQDRVLPRLGLAVRLML